jgi:hypothetical protein
VKRVSSRGPRGIGPGAETVRMVKCFAADILVPAADAMKSRIRCLVLVLLVHVVAQSGACTGKGRGSVDAHLGVDAAFCFYGNTTYAPGETFTVGCQSCSCLPSGAVDCVAGICLVDLGPARSDQQDTLPGDGCAGADQACLYGGGALAVGESGADGCSTYSCGAGGKLTCTAGACSAVDAGVPKACVLPTRLEFGLYGGFMVDDTNNVLDTTGTLTVEPSAGRCVSELPACGTPCAITVATIAKDLADPEVQAAFASDPGTLFGARRGSGDVANSRMTLGDGQSILVGFPCCQGSDLPCQPIPQGVQRLVNDLQAMLAANTGCR